MEKGIREYKSNVFIMLFSNRKELLSLYNAVNGTNYENADDLVINTLEGDKDTVSGLFSHMKNDVSFLFQSKLNLYEHQRTDPVNIPLRLLIYLSDLIRTMVPRQKLYGTSMVKVPTPRFVVFFNGTKDMPDVQEYRLSDLFEIPEDKPALELIVKVYNINKGKNQKLMEQCGILSEYAEFTDRARKALGNAKAGQHKAALETVVSECIEDGIVRTFLTEHRESVIMSYYWEYDQAAHEAALRSDGYEDGFQDGETNILQLINWLSENNRADEIVRIAKDERLRKTLMDEFSRE